MSNYLTKEEIRQWRSSLEKITLEEFAARLGKTVEESKATNDVVDIVMTKGTSSNTTTNMKDGFSAIAERAFQRERQISHTPFSVSRKELAQSLEKANKTEEKPVKKEEVVKPIIKDTKVEKAKNTLKKNEVLAKKAKEIGTLKKNDIVLKKALTDREQLVFEYFLNNVGKTVFAKELALLLDLPRDYVYKYIKNLRAKIDGENLKNVPSGGFVLNL